MSVALSAAQMLAAAKHQPISPTSSATPDYQHQHAASAQPLTVEDEEELRQYLPRTFDTTAAPQLQPLEHYALSSLPAGGFLVPDFVSASEEAELLSLVGDSPSASWVQLKKRTLQMWGGFPSAAAQEEEFVPSQLPAWQTQLISRMAAAGLCSATAGQSPNHVLLNRYRAGEGIMPHFDGPLYEPRVAILSLGSHTVMRFYAQLADSLPGAHHKPAFSLYLPPRSLFLFSQDLYTRYLHSIEERTEDVLDASIVGVPAELVGQTLARHTRVSLTIRRVHTLAEKKAALVQPADAQSSSSSSGAITGAAVPVIDLTGLLDGSVGPDGGPSEARLRVARDIFAACTTSGFFYISHHGIPLELQDRLDRLSRAFFALPLVRKMRLEMSLGGRAWRGFFPVGAELTSGKPDIKEGLYLGTELADDHPLVAQGTPLHGRNLFPDEDLPELRPTVLEYIERVTNLAHAIMEAVALGLGLEANYFRAHYTADPTVLFRIFNYPEHASSALAKQDAASWGVGEHTDYGVLTILRQDASGGLQVKSPEHGWIEAPPIENTFVCNIGDMLERLTGGRFQSTPHRVRNIADHDRISFPLFFDPAWNARVQPLPLDHLPPADVSQDRHKRWDKSSVHSFQGTYGDYLLAKVGKVFPALAEKKNIAGGAAAPSSA